MTAAVEAPQEVACCSACGTAFRASSAWLRTLALAEEPFECRGCHPHLYLDRPQDEGRPLG